MADPKPRRESMVRVACIQMEPVVGEKERNLRHSLSLIGKAADNGAKLIVLPELCNSGYMFSSREEAFSLAEDIPDGPTAKAWMEIAASRDLHLVAGIAERDGRFALQFRRRDRPVRLHRHIPQGSSLE